MSKVTLKPAVRAGLLALAIAMPASLAASENDWWDRMGRMMGGGPPMGHWAEGPMMGRYGAGGMSGPMMGFGVDTMLDRIDGRLEHFLIGLNRGGFPTGA